MIVSHKYSSTQRRSDLHAVTLKKLADAVAIS